MFSSYRDIARFLDKSQEIILMDFHRFYPIEADLVFLFFSRLKSKFQLHFLQSYRPAHALLRYIFPSLFTELRSTA